MKNKILTPNPLLVVFLQTGALLADSVAEVQRISTSTLARSSAEKQRDGGKGRDLEAIRSWQLHLGVADSEQGRGRKREGGYGT